MVCRNRVSGNRQRGSRFWDTRHPLAEKTSEVGDVSQKPWPPDDASGQVTSSDSCYGRLTRPPLIESYLAAIMVNLPSLRLVTTVSLPVSQRVIQGLTRKRLTP